MSGVRRSQTQEGRSGSSSGADGSPAGTSLSMWSARRRRPLLLLLLLVALSSRAQQGEEDDPLAPSNTTALPPPTTLGPDNATSVWGDRCIRPAIEQFPRTLMPPWLRTHGGFVFHVLIAAYTFLALALICDEFFVPSLERMCEVLKIQPDVAGATFMAAGSSAPELATALIGVFVAHDDIGVSGVIGSAVFNIMFVIALCALTTERELLLNWWPMVRDCAFYFLAILALLFSIMDEQITWVESTLLLLLYLLYCAAMYHNALLEAWAHTLPIPFPVHTPPKLDHPPSSFDMDEYQEQEPPLEEAAPVKSAEEEAIALQGIGRLVGRPEGASWMRVGVWRLQLPLVHLLRVSVPDCRTEKWEAWYVATFGMAMLWIALFSYLMVWMITVVGFTLGVPDTVMGLTFVAAGVSVPDALSSLAVMREGLGDMAVSNAVGSNVFDILICLGLPWFLSTVLIHPGQPVQVISKGLTYSTLSLLSTVAFLLIATHMNGWRMNKTYGVFLLLWYLLFMILASLYELNVFWESNPPECASLY